MKKFKGYNLPIFKIVAKHLYKWQQKVLWAWLEPFLHPTHLKVRTSTFDNPCNWIANKSLWCYYRHRVKECAQRKVMKRARQKNMEKLTWGYSFWIEITKSNPRWKSGWRISHSKYFFASFGTKTVRLVPLRLWSLRVWRFKLRHSKSCLKILTLENVSYLA